MMNIPLLIGVFAVHIGLTLGQDESADTGNSRGMRVEDIQSQDYVDLKKFTGIWYEIARTRSAPRFSTVESVIRYFELGPDQRSSVAYFSGSINGTCLPAWKVLIQQRCSEGPGDYFARMLDPSTPWGVSKVLYTDYKVAVMVFCMAQDEDGRCQPNATVVALTSREKRIPSQRDQYLRDVLWNRTGIDPVDLVPTQYETYCLRQVLDALSPGNDDCVVSKMQVQENFDMNRFAGTWFPVAASKFVPRPELVSSPMCYSRSGSRSFTVSHITVGEHKCQSTFPFTISLKCPLTKLGDFLVNKGIPMAPGDLVFSFFKVLYTDYDVAVGYGCIAVTPEGTCVQNFTGAAILSRTPEISPNRRQLLDDFLRRACIDPESLQDASFSDEERACGCPGTADNEGGGEAQEGGDNGKLQHFVQTELLGLWYDVASTPAVKDRLPGMDSMLTFYRLGPHNTLQATFTAAKDGVCIPPLNPILQSACAGEREGMVLTSLPPPRFTSWYSFVYLFVDDEITIGAQCGDRTCDTIDKDLVRVQGRSPDYNNVTQAKVNALLETMWIDPNTVSPMEYSVDCSHKLFEKSERRGNADGRTCPVKIRDIPMQANLTASDWFGPWHVVSANLKSNNLLLLESMMIYHAMESDGSTTVYVGGRVQGTCLPVTSMRVRPRCEDEPFGEMWMTRGPDNSNSSLHIAATAKVIYGDDETLVLYSCGEELEDGTCDPDTARALLLARDWDIGEDKLSELKERVTLACLDPVDLLDTSSLLPYVCRREWSKVVCEN